MRSRWLHPITQRSPPSVSLAGFIIPGGYLPCHGVAARAIALAAKTGLAGPIVRQDARGFGGRLAKPRSGLPLRSRGEGPWGGPEAT